MKAAVLHQRAKIEVEEVATPSPGPGEIRLQVAYCGVCGSDLPRLIKDGAHFFPIILGHEFSGIIEQVGDSVDSALLQRQAACAPLLPNFSDPECIKGNFSLGKGYDFIGSRRQGGMAEYVVMPQENAVLLDQDVNLLEASFMEPLTVALHAINIMSFSPGKEVAVIGAGSIGLLMLQCLKELGASRVTVFDVDEAKLGLAEKMGADHCFLSTDKEVSAKVTQVTSGGRGFQYVFEMAGVPAAEKFSLQIAGPKGGIMFVGTPHSPLTLQPDEFELINRKELTLQGSWMNYSAPFPGWEWTYAAELLAKKKVCFDGVVDRILPLSKADEIPALLQTPGALKGKIVIDSQA